MKKFNELKNAILAMEGDADKFYAKSNNAAGTRLRKGMLEVKKLAQNVRLDVLAKRG